MIPSVLAGVTPRDIDTIKVITRKAYPSVPQLSTDRVAQWMETSNDLLLIDVRSAEEFAVSHLRGAIHAQTRDQIAAIIEKRQPAKVILYCAVGFRSSRLAHALAEHSMGGLMNLEGSIFQWANEGRAVFQGERQTHRVHPYAKRWAGLLKPGLASA